MTTAPAWCVPPATTLAKHVREEAGAIASPARHLTLGNRAEPHVRAQLAISITALPHVRTATTVVRLLLAQTPQLIDVRPATEAGIASCWAISPADALPGITTTALALRPVHVAITPASDVGDRTFCVPNATPPSFARQILLLTLAIVILAITIQAVLSACPAIRLASPATAPPSWVASLASAGPCGASTAPSAAAPPTTTTSLISASRATSVVPPA